jgi:UDP-N-acetylmuramyl tripeptide synthase
LLAALPARARYPSCVNPRTWAAITIGRLAGVASRTARRGGGTAVAGLIAQQIDPRLAGRLAAQLGHGCAVVTGTNGKTTTARMLAAIAGEAGLRTLANPSGSNLMRGVATALLSATDPFGRVRDAADRLGVFEVDEATLPEAAAVLRPRAIVFTNLFRDQLDRYGEVDTVARLWQRTVEGLTDETTLVLNTDDPAVASLTSSTKARVLTFGIDDTRVAEERLEHASDYRFCLSCGEELAYTAAFFGHVGHWRCPSCGRARPAPDVRATCVEFASERLTRLTIATHQGDPSTALRAGLHIELPLAGLYNAENALAAAAGSIALGLPPAAIERALSSFRAAFGRQERFELDGRTVLVLLGKNPTGVNQVLRTITFAHPPQADGLHLLLFLNDGIADGRDISWIWDADYELIADRVASVVVSGTRAEELALRLKYADLRVEPQIVHDAQRALDAALTQTPPGETLYVVPTYTAMLEIRELLARRGQRPHFWEES